MIDLGMEDSGPQKPNKRFGSLDVIRESIKLLDPVTRRKYYLVSILQIFLSLLDLLGVALVGVIAALTLRGVKSEAPGDRTQSVLNFFHMDNLTFQSQVAVLAAVTVILLVGKTIVSILITRRTLIFLSNRSAAITSDLIRNVLNQPLSNVYSRGVHELHYVLGPGVNGITLGILGVFATIISDASLLVVLGVGLSVLSPIIALSSLLLFGLIAVALHYLMRRHAASVGSVVQHAEMDAGRLLSESFDLYRELYVRDRRGKYARDIEDVRRTSARAQAEQTFLPNVSKYVIEIAIISGSVLIAGVQFVTQTSTIALASLGLFLVAGGRIAPALMRLQQSFMNLENRSATLKTTLETIKIFEKFSAPVTYKPRELFDHEGFSPTVQLNNIRFGFDTESDFFKDLDLQINAGETVAIVGPSGGGKTTLVNLLLGLLPAESGQILISGLEPLIAVTKWPGSIAYVPQEVKLIRGTFRENIEIGLSKDETSTVALNAAIASSHLDNLVKELPNGLSTIIGEAGFQISGGQKQRLGLARAFYTNPKIIILDEATSALDSETEKEVSDSLNSIKGQVTVIVIAHRLSTVRNADQVVYLERGKVLATGTFEEVRTLVPDFDQQAKLMGL
jgi:ABC-type multidrug transport system fused ATPase/permease subunit